MNYLKEYESLKAKLGIESKQSALDNDTTLRGAERNVPTRKSTGATSHWSDKQRERQRICMQRLRDQRRANGLNGMGQPHKGTGKNSLKPKTNN